jgi:hypothetical protein
VDGLYEDMRRKTSCTSKKWPGGCRYIDRGLYLVWAGSIDPIETDGQPRQGFKVKNKKKINRRGQLGSS